MQGSLFKFAGVVLKKIESEPAKVDDKIINFYLCFGGNAVLGYIF